MADIEAFLSILENITTLGIMALGLRYVDGLRQEERKEKKERTEDIVKDWKRIREIEN